MTEQVPTHPDIERVIFITADCLRWDYHEQYKSLYPSGTWYRATAQATFTPASHASAFTGLNPPRTGVLDFGGKLTDDNLLTNCDSVSLSGITNDERNVIRVEGFDNTRGTFAFLESIGEDGEAWQFNTEKVSPGELDEFDFAFFHDWIIHGCGLAHEGADWAKCIRNADGPEEAHEFYQWHIDKSVEAHENLLEALKAEGLYEETLFVVWGDHGQALGEEPYEELLGHTGIPCEGQSRVPIGFCSPLFEEENVDTKTNARGVDIAPTILSVFTAAGIEYDEFDHEFEGVDLTEFDGELAGYTISALTKLQSTDDAVRSADYAYLSRHIEEYLSTPRDDSVTQEFADAEEVRDETVDFYEAFRREHTKGVISD